LHSYLSSTWAILVTVGRITGGQSANVKGLRPHPHPRPHPQHQHQH